MYNRVIQKQLWQIISLTNQKMQKPNLMILRKLSNKFHAEVLVFSCLKMARWKKSCISVLCQNGGFAQHGSILHGLKPQVTPKAALTSQNTTQIRQVSPSDTPRHPHSIRHYRHPRISSNIQGGFLVSQYMRSWTKVEPSYHFSTTLKGKIFLDLIIFRHKNTKTAQ